MKTSKILIKPEFKSLPRTEVANIQENIEKWISKGEWNKIETFCRKDSKYKTGYRFINSSDMDETIITNQTVSKITFQITWFRKVCAKDHLCPLWLSELYTDITLKYKDFEFVFTSDNDLRNKIKYIKNELNNN